MQKLFNFKVVAFTLGNPVLFFQERFISRNKIQEFLQFIFTVSQEEKICLHFLHECMPRWIFSILTATLFTSEHAFISWKMLHNLQICYQSEFETIPSALDFTTCAER